jgi:hypothetical protein
LTGSPEAVETRSVFKPEDPCVGDAGRAGAIVLLGLREG